MQVGQNCYGAARNERVTCDSVYVMLLVCQKYT
jgi:hypothetical protein